MPDTVYTVPRGMGVVLRFHLLPYLVLVSVLRVPPWTDTRYRVRYREYMVPVVIGQ